MIVRIFGKRVELPDITVYVGLGFLLFLVVTYIAVLNRNTPYYEVLSVSSFVALLLPPLAYLYYDYIRVKNTEKMFPQFLRDLADTQRSGLPLPKALADLSRLNYGELTPHVKKLSVWVSWGIPFDEAFVKFAESTRSNFIKYVVLLIVEAYRSGGKTADILDMVAEDATRLYSMREERSSAFSGFVGTIYVIFLIFLGLSYIVINNLLPEIPTGGALLGGSTKGLDESRVRSLFLHLTLLEAIFAGLMAGLAGEGSLSAGIRHAILLSVIGLSFYFVFLAQPDPIQRLVSVAEKVYFREGTTMKVGTFFLSSDIRAEDLSQRTGKDINFYFSALPTCEACGKEIVVERNGIRVIKPSYVDLGVLVRKKGEIIVEVG